MIIKINRLIIVLLGLMLCFAGCYKDKGNYGYQDINDVAIIANDTIVANTGDTLKIVPEIQQAKAVDENRLTYEWGVAIDDGTGAAANEYRILATTRNLNALINLVPHTRPYAMLYKVKDTVTGITYKKVINLLVNAKYQTGWMLLENNGTVADISFINTVNNTSYRHVFSTENPGITLPVSAHQTFNFYDIQAANTIVLFANQGYVLDYYTQKKVALYSTLFAYPPAVFAPQAIYNDGVSRDVVTINNGKLYRELLSQGILEFLQPYSVQDTMGLRDYRLSPIVGYSGNDAIYFDQLNHRFLHENFGITQLRTLNDIFPSWTVDGFDPNNITDSLLAMGPDYNNDIRAIMKVPGTTDYGLYIIGVGNRYYNTQKFVLGEAGNPHLGESPAYVFSTKRFQFYYAYKNDLYLCNMNGWGGNNSYVVYSFPAGENVTAMNNLKVSGAFDKLVIATYNGSTANFHEFELNDLGEVDGSAPEHTYKGFNKIINISYKK